MEAAGFNGFMLYNGPHGVGMWAAARHSGSKSAVGPPVCFNGLSAGKLPVTKVNGQFFG
jgi:hypothetical protein